MKNRKESILIILIVSVKTLPYSGDFISLINSEVNSIIFIIENRIENALLNFQMRIAAKTVKSIDSKKEEVIINCGSDGIPFVFAEA